MKRALTLVVAMGIGSVGCEPGPSGGDAGAVDATSASDAGASDDAAGEDARVEPGDAPPPMLDAPSTGGAYAAPVALGELTGVPETSGIVASRDHPGIFWVHNDSGNPAEIYAIDESARVVATITLAGATNQDWEDIAIVPIDGVDLLYVGDHGDNLARTSGGASSSRSGTVRLYRIEEPDPAEGDVRVPTTAIDLAYPDGPHDCEGMFVDPGSADVYLFSKVDGGMADLYRGSALTVPGPNVLEHVGRLDMVAITGADVSSDGERLAVRNYSQIRVFTVDGGDVAGALAGAPLMPSTRGSAAEAIAFAPSGWDLYTIAEGDPSTLFRIAWE
jgi:hypothetical protein